MSLLGVGTALSADRKRPFARRQYSSNAVSAPAIATARSEGAKGGIGPDLSQMKPGSRLVEGSRFEGRVRLALTQKTARTCEGRQEILVV